jgi:tRNA nucleotidyltransferase/poly(A) polymerase
MTPVEGIRIEDDWLHEPRLRTLFELLCKDGGTAMVAGGAVRNALMELPVDEVDLCTDLLPQEVTKRVEDAGHKAIPTGIEHGTITAVIDSMAFEITTLREDIETDGRHAVVKFGTDWQGDAERRDLTMNGLFCDRDGNVYDYVGGVEDIRTGVVRFIGDSDRRIKEDSLRILRFFRFFAWYGQGRPDAAGLKACNANKMLLSGLSVERVWMETKKLLSAPDPSRGLLWMRTTGILGGILPETVKWGIDSIPGLLRNEQTHGWSADPLLRLMAMIRPHDETVMQLAKRLLLSKSDTARLVHWADSVAPPIETKTGELEKLLYRGNQQGMLDAMRLEIVHLQNRDDEAGSEAMARLVKHVQDWQKPELPIKGQDLLDTGMSPGKQVGERLSALEEEWIESGFALTREDLLSKLD